MVNWGVIVGALFGIVVYPFVVIALHQLFTSTEQRQHYDRDDVEPPSAHDTYLSRTMPGGNRQREK